MMMLQKISGRTGIWKLAEAVKKYRFLRIAEAEHEWEIRFGRETHIT